MEDNTQEKNLIPKKEKNIFGKIKNWFKSLFSKKENNIQEEINEEEINIKENNQFKENIKIAENEETELLELQRKFREGEIEEGDLTNEQIDSLCNLYDKQIAALKDAIEKTNQEIEEYKKRKMEKKNA